MISCCRRWSHLAQHGLLLHQPSRPRIPARIPAPRPCHTRARAPTQAAAAMQGLGFEGAEAGAWQSLGTPPQELLLANTLPTGQTFRWRESGPGEYLGLVGQRVVRMRQAEGDVLWRVVGRGAGADPGGDAPALSDYFNLGTALAPLAEGWAAADPRFRAVHPLLPGARMLRQDPVECLFQFLCSSNNHISRIHGMVERLCTRYGTPLASAAAAEGAGGEAAPGLSLHAFPSLAQLESASEEALRGEGYGYRARFVVGTVAALKAKPGGGEAWLAGLREASYEEAAEALCTLPGVGPKVAACVCLFSLDKHAAIPVDTHVWQLALRHYTPHLRGRTLTPKLHGDVQAAFVARFGPYAGWAHNTLFISELATTKARLAEAAAAAAAAAVEGAVKQEGGGAESEGSSGEPGTPPQVDAAPGAGGRRKRAKLAE